MSLVSEALFERAQAVIPGGVNSPVRAFGSVGGSPYFVARASGPHIWDADGRKLIDMVQSYGAIIAGHAEPSITAAIVGAAGRGTSYGAPTEGEVRLAEMISDRVPSCEKVRLVSSGTEATMTAIRLARGATGRDRIVKFAGNYHGHSDSLLVDSGSAVAMIEADSVGAPGSAGVPRGAVADTLVLPYNVVPRLDETIAAVIVEPVAANMGLVSPAQGFLEGLRAECSRVGAVLIFDEVITGFRVAAGGAQQRLGVTPDLSSFGKVIGGGLNVGAFGGRRELMDSLAPLGPVYQAGTLSGNPLATAAGLAALELLDAAAYEQLEASAMALSEGLEAAFSAAGLKVLAPRYGPLVGLFVGSPLPEDYRSASTTNAALYAELFHGLLRRGVALAPGPYEVMFPGLAHSEKVISQVVEAAGEVAFSLAERR